MNINWSQQAKKEYEEILHIIATRWGLKEVEKFIQKTEAFLNIIKENPYCFIKSTKKDNICKALITKHNTLFYLIKPKKMEIILLSFWDNRKNPNKQKY